MNNKEPGYIYMQTRSTFGRLHTCKNPSFREDWVKIGKSSCLVDVRSKELSNTTLLPFVKRAQLCPWDALEDEPEAAGNIDYELIINMSDYVL